LQGPPEGGRYVLMKVLAIAVGAMLLAAAPAPQTFNGVITDDNCANGDHSRMRMGETDGECTVACVDAHGSSYLLFDGRNAYTLSDQKTPEKFAGKPVIVTGTLDEKTKTIQVSSIKAKS
jgi:hypothetical protein